VGETVRLGADIQEGAEQLEARDFPSQWLTRRQFVQAQARRFGGRRSIHDGTFS